MTAVSLDSILNYLPFSEALGTAGQPLPEQFALIRQAGYQVVVNLAMPTSTNYLPDEADLVAAQGLEYVAIPVPWDAPALEHLERFFAVMDQNRGRKVFVHCALNMRVSAFCLLYRVLRLGVPLDVARQDMLRIWEPDGVWATFLEQALAAPTLSLRGAPPLGAEAIPDL